MCPAPGRHSPCSQWTPVFPGEQTQVPDTGSQAAPCPHAHTWVQPGPKRPWGQAVERAGKRLLPPGLCQRLHDKVLLGTGSQAISTETHRHNTPSPVWTSTGENPHVTKEKVPFLGGMVGCRDVLSVRYISGTELARRRGPSGITLMPQGRTPY